MQASNPTPGPWILADENNQCCSVLLGEQNNLVCSLDRQDMNTGKFVIERDEMLANARLIAAAPDLLAALRQITSLTQDDPATEWNVALNQCAAAIAKATGSQP